MGEINYENQELTDSRFRNGFNDFGFRTSSVRPLTELMPSYSPCFENAPDTTSDTFIGYKSVTIERLDEYLDLIVQASNSGAIPPRHAYESINMIERAMQNDPENDSVENKIYGPNKKIVDLSMITNALNLGFMNEIEAWKSALKTLGKKAGLERKHLNTVLEDTFSELASEYNWKLNAEIDSLFVNGDATENEIHLTFERERPAITFLLSKTPSEVQDLFQSGYLGISDHSICMLEIFKDSCELSEDIIMGDGSLKKLMKNEGLRNWLLSEDLANLFTDEVMNEDKKRKIFRDHCDKLKIESKDIKPFINLIESLIFHEDHEGGTTLLASYIEYYSATLKTDDCIDILINSECPKQRFLGLCAEFLSNRKGREYVEYHLVKNKTYSQIASNLYISFDHPKLVGTIIEAGHKRFFKDVCQSADETCGNMGHGERGTGLVLNIREPTKPAVANQQAMQATIDSLILFLTIYLW